MSDSSSSSKRLDNLHRRRIRLESWLGRGLLAAFGVSLALTLALAGCLAANFAGPQPPLAVSPLPGSAAFQPTATSAAALPSHTPSQVVIVVPTGRISIPTAIPPTATPIPSTSTPNPTDTPVLPPTDLPASPIPTDPPLPPITFAVIGDFGSGDEHAEAVANLVKSWDPDLIITVGDNNYPDGLAETIDANIGQWYSDYIYPYHGVYGPGGDENRFFPAIGNHDWTGEADGYQPFLDYFELPGNERYYDFTWGPVHFFCVNSDSHEVDKVGRSSAQAEWLKERMAASTLPWKIVFTHYPPYSSGLHGDTDWIQWPFTDWGATAVISGHEHSYERLFEDGIPYFVNGLGGGDKYPIARVRPGSMVQYDSDFGAMLVEASANEIVFQFINIENEVIDVYAIKTYR